MASGAVGGSEEAAIVIAIKLGAMGSVLLFIYLLHIDYLIFRLALYQVPRRVILGSIAGEQPLGEQRHYMAELPRLRSCCGTAAGYIYRLAICS